jgi:hypothetical protein
VVFILDNRLSQEYERQGGAGTAQAAGPTAEAESQACGPFAYVPREDRELVTNARYIADVDDKV